MKTRIVLSFALMLLMPLAGATPFGQATASLLSLVCAINTREALAVQAPAQVKADAAASKSKPAAASPRKVASKTSSRKKADTVANQLPNPKLDLSLPKDMVDALKPEPKGNTAPAKASNRLPAMFNKPAGQEDFELNGRLISNEMDLNLRNESRRDVEGAALDFKFRQ